MFKRFTRAIAAWFNRVLEVVEDPETVLRHNIRDMHNQIPKLNEGLVRAQATVRLLVEEGANLKVQEKTLVYKIKKAAEANEEAYGVQLALQLKRVRENLEKQKVAETSAKKGLEAMRTIRESQIAKIKLEVGKIKDVMNSAKIAKLKGEVAQVFQSYEVGDMAYSNDEALDSMRRQTAEDEARFENLSENVGELKIEATMEEAEAKELYESFKK